MKENAKKLNLTVFFSLVTGLMLRPAKTETKCFHKHRTRQKLVTPKQTN